ILPAEGELTVLVHALRDDHARQSAWASDIRLFGAWSTKKTMGYDWLAALEAILSEKHLLDGTLGYDGDFLSVARLRMFQERFPSARFQDATKIITESRMIKDAAEIAAMRAACDLTDVGMETALAVAAAGKNEREI